VPPGTRKSYKSQGQYEGRPWGMTRDPAEIRNDFNRWRNAGIGIPTGAVNRIVVLDVDTEAGHGVDGAAALQELEIKHGSLTLTLTSISPSGSIHHYFRHPGVRIPNSESAIGRGLDIRGDGGMVLAPPTIRPGVGIYRWLDRRPIAPMPAWLIELTKEQPPPRPIKILPPAGNFGRGYGAAALRYEIETLTNAPNGQRNAQLNRSSFVLHQLVAGGVLDGAEVKRRLIEAATANGSMDDRQNGGLRAILATIDSGARAGLLHPRQPR
jgi:putative DNA primase/helicase